LTVPVDICNRALQEIGAQATISTINPSDGSTEGNACSILYTPKIQALHRSAHWNFARKQLALTQLKAQIVNGVVSTNPPPVPWLYEYAYPEDCLKARFLIPLNLIDGQPVIPFTTGANVAPIFLRSEAAPFVVGTDLDSTKNTIRVILTNVPAAILVYTADFSQLPDLWDPHFANAADAYLGAWLVNALARNRDLWRDQMALVKDVVEAARVSDGNEGITTVDHYPDWMRVRAATGAYYQYYDSQCYYGWDSVSFPSGSAF